MPNSHQESLIISDYILDFSGKKNAEGAKTNVPTSSKNVGGNNMPTENEILQDIPVQVWPSMQDKKNLFKKVVSKQASNLTNFTDEGVASSRKTIGSKGTSGVVIGSDRMKQANSRNDYRQQRPFSGSIPMKSSKRKGLLEAYNSHVRKPTAGHL